jgi:TIR domain-containing protein
VPSLPRCRVNTGYLVNDRERVKPEVMGRSSRANVVSGVDPMAEHSTFTGFFSYAHHDAETDSSLIEDFTTRLEGRVGSRLTNARFAIWRDERNLRTGERWNDKIEAELRRADVLIVLLTPQWMNSDYCRKEYSIFEEMEASRVGQYVAPILARPIEQQEKYFTPEQKEIYSSIANRQFFKATNFLNRSRARRNAEIDKMADDIAGMIDRLRQLAKTPEPSVARRHTARVGQREFSARAENYAEVDFLRAYEVRVDRTQTDYERGVYAQVDFVERLFVKSAKAYIEFGVRHAILSVASADPGQLRQFDGFHVQDVDRAAYVSLQDFPEAVSVAMYASLGRGLAELALPPTNNNYWSRIATATPEARSERLRAELRVSFSAHGLHIADGRSQHLSQATKRKIEAIIGVAVEKNERIGHDGRICRSVPIRERIP